MRVSSWKRSLLDFTAKGQRRDVWGGAQAGLESLDFMTEKIEKEKLLRFLGETEMDDIGVVGNLGPEKFQGQKERCESKFGKEPDLNE